MMYQASRGTNRRLRSVLSTTAKASALACLAFTLAPATLGQESSAAPAPAAPAASAQTGSVFGKVTNAATGAVLQRAKVTVEGTFIETFTDEFGEYRLELPEGTTNIKVSYTGMKDKVLDVEVIGGETMMQDFNVVGEGIASSGSGKDEVVTLDAFSVTEGRETNAYNIANNEQRYSVSIKNVVAADAFGDVTEGNIGEFIKYLPGISVDYVAADIRTINVRGFGPQFTNISFNGMRITSSASGSNNRIVELEQVSINNVARAEVTKVPTPDQPADSLGGNVNMISKNSFERKGVSFNWKAYGSINSENLTLKRTPGPKDSKGYKILPGADFDLTIPFTKNFGVVLTGLTSNQYNEQHRSQPVWQHNQSNKTTDAAATPLNPYLNNYEWQDGPKQTARNSFNLRADWRIAPGHTLNVGYQNNFYDNFFGNRNQRFTIGTTAAGSASAINGVVPTTVTPLSWDTTNYVQSATGRGSVTQGSSYRNKNGQTQAADLYYRMKTGDWEADAGIHAAVSKSWYRDLSRGWFNNVGTRLNNVAVVRLEGLTAATPDKIIVKNQTGAEIDYTKLDNYYVTTANTNELDGRAKLKGAFANVKRTFDVGIPIGVKTGFSFREESRDNVRHQITYDFLGADKVANTADNLASLYASNDYKGQDSYWGLKTQEWVSPWKLGQLFKEHPEYFAVQKGGADAHVYDAQNSVYIKERVSATFLQFDGKLFHNKLHWTTGVRFEKTETEGDGMLFAPDNIYQRKTDGSFVTDSAGKKVRKAEAGAAGSLAEKQLQYTIRGSHAEGSYDGYYPSLHLNYNITDDVILRFAYAKTYGRPDFADIIPNVSIPEASIDTTTGQETDVPGVITVSNAALKPWTGDNFDLSLEYYYPKGGTLQVGVFRKYLEDFWTTQTIDMTPALADQFGVDYDRYQNWTISSKFNGKQARISGLESNVVLPLKHFGNWGKYLNFTANGTVLSLDGEATADFRNFITRTGNIGLTFSKKPFVVMVKVNYRGRQKYPSQTGAQYGSPTAEMGGLFYEYYRSRAFIDLNFEYQLTKKLSMFANVRNVTNKAQELIRENRLTPLYASNYRTEEYGLQWAVGVKGKF